ncbi:hypothetical protein K2173_010471 [Erythroxylum novogranatense]|uniref:Translation initiation factor 3 N-terminal domain-containing protein n=1 Tax=Erythroxylum novogranatense TaxID=1862640 RepID=A0AAV8TG79_9ROSI|nr:hypothetical protein K2173_010471 [Erythroxylum novogranatense]
MAFFGRINQTKLKLLSNQFKRCYSLIACASSSFVYTTRAPRSLVSEPLWAVHDRHCNFHLDVRFFAAPAQFKSNKEDKSTIGPRLNDEITGQTVRLVYDEGHVIVSLHEALQQARKLNLDLVEVQRNANPPVCKIMDFHKEKYAQELKAKEHAKSKSELQLRKGECKEVRFTGKIEQKDLKMKADTVKRLMERGYRVKCMAMPSSKHKVDDSEDLGALLSRLTPLIEDASVVESGPRVEKRQAYVIVRHVKFGQSKKGNSKKLKDVQNLASLPESEDETSESVEDDRGNWSVVDSTDNFDKAFDLKSADTLPSSPPETIETKNRYKRSAPRNDFQQSLTNGRDLSRYESQFTNQPRQSQSRFESRFPNQVRQPLSDTHFTPSNGSRKDVTDSSAPRRIKHPIQMPKQESVDSDMSSNSSHDSGRVSPLTLNAPAKKGMEENRYGRFSPSTSITSGPGKQDREENRYGSSRNPNAGGFRISPSFPGSESSRSHQPGINRGGQGRWGAFSRDNPKYE